MLSFGYNRNVASRCSGELAIPGHAVLDNDRRDSVAVLGPAHVNQ